MPGEPTVVLVVPITPASTGNGLAMRAGMLLDALAPAAAVHVVVVPVSGTASDRRWADQQAESLTVVPPVAPQRSREHTTRQLADAQLRDRLARTAPLPARAALAPPTLADEIVDALALPTPPSVVLAMRLYLAPLGVWLARRLQSDRVVIDADDDDGALLRSLGESTEAEAFDRLARCWLPDATVVTAASADAARGIAARAGISAVHVLPNAVQLPEDVAPAPGGHRLLFVGNLTYEPNAAAARELVHEILPAVRTRFPATTIDLVGSHGGALEDLQRVPGVRLPGAVPGIRPHYESADVVVVPLRHGSGTRIKVLEAFAHERPVVSTPVGVAGLDLHHDEAVIADAPDDVARAALEVLEDPVGARAMTTRARDLVARRYSYGAVAPAVRAAVLGPPA